MKKSIIKFLCLSIISSSLFAIPANAGTWVPAEAQGSWIYINDDGTQAVGWQYIDGNWYYFIDDSWALSIGDAQANTCYIGLNCYWDNSIGSYIQPECVYIDGKCYYFDSNGHMLHDCFIIQGRGLFQYWLNSDGSVDPRPHGYRYSSYDLSQVK